MKPPDRRVKDTGLPILTFHSIGGPPSLVSTTPEVFRAILQRLHDLKYESIHLMQAATCLGSGTPLPRRAFIITFDDGYETVYRIAFPVLAELKMTATLFVTIGDRKSRNLPDRLPSLGGHKMLSWQELREMQDAGHSIGAHTLTHPRLNRLPWDLMRTEIVDSKENIEDRLGRSVHCFAYPYGRYDQRVLGIVREHFQCACTDIPGFVNSRSDVYLLPRIDSYFFRTPRLVDLFFRKPFKTYAAGIGAMRKLRRACEPFFWSGKT